MWNTLLLALAFSFGISCLVTPLAIILAKRLKLMDDPARHKHPAIIHKKPIPRAGGMPIFLAIVIASFLFLPQTHIFISIFIAGFFVVAIGLLDDRLDLSPYLRFFINILCASFVVFQGISLPFITNPLGGIFHFPTIQLFGIALPVALPLAILWIVWVMNMLNWSKGVDGQMPGIAAIAAIFIGIASLRFPSDPMNIFAAKMSFIVAGSALGFLVYNFYPAKIFPGYSATILGFCLGILSLLSGVKLATALLVMGVPMVDALFTIIRRIASKRSPFWHDKGHLHHLLLDFGWSQRSIALFYWAMSILLGLIALNLSSKGKAFAIIVVIVLVTGFIFTLRYVTRKEE